MKLVELLLKCIVRKIQEKEKGLELTGCLMFCLVLLILICWVIEYHATKKAQKLLRVLEAGTEVSTEYRVHFHISSPE
jgi:hypothetical protein